MSKFEQWGGLAALLSGILGFLYFPFDASSFFAKKGEDEFSGIIPWSDTLRGRTPTDTPDEQQSH